MTTEESDGEGCLVEKGSGHYIWQMDEEEGGWGSNSVHGHPIEKTQ